MNISLLDATALLRGLPAGVVVHGADTHIQFANPKALSILRLSEDQILGKTALDPYWKFVDRFKKPLPVSAYPVNIAIASDAPVNDYVIGVVDGSTEDVTWVIVNAYRECNALGDVERVIVSFADISREQDDIPFRDVVQLADDVVIITKADPENPAIVYVNQAFTTLTGYAQNEVIGKTPSILQRDETDPLTRQRIREALTKGEPIRETILNFHKDGGRYWLDMNIVPLFGPHGELSYFAAVERDVTALKEKEAVLVNLAKRDALTGLLNRRGFMDISENMVTSALRDTTAMSLAMLDIDLFKTINDTHGHEAGDAALCHFAKLIQSSFRANDVVARVGGEEFVVVLVGVDVTGCLRVLEQFREKVASTGFLLQNGTTLKMTVSIGVTALNSTDKEVNELLKRSDMAMYEAKRSGRNKLISI